MADLFLGQTCTEAYKFISGGSAYTFAFNFQPDKVVFNNLTDWTSTAGGFPVNVWFRDQTDDGDAYQMKVIDSAAAQSFNFVKETTNGFTVADTAGGQADLHSAITGITAADPGVITHDAFTFQTNQIVRLTDLGNTGAVDNGMAALNNNRYRIVVLTATTFSLKDVITGEPIDTTNFDAYQQGGLITLETNVISLNNPQVTPYSASNPYLPNPFSYDPITYQLTAGTAVMGNDGDVFLIEVYKWGEITDLGDIG